jgi:hypothetical protein
MAEKSKTLINHKYLVFCSERSDGPPCNEDHVWLVESVVEPTRDMIVGNFVHPGSCMNVSYPGCENCGGSTIIAFHVEPYSNERAAEFDLTDDRWIQKLK